MIPRRINKRTFSLDKILGLSVLALLVVGAWALTQTWPFWARGLAGLLVAVPGLILIFGSWHGRRVPKIMADAVQYITRPRRMVWARTRRSALRGHLRTTRIWWWRLLAGVPRPSEQVILASVVATLITILIASLIGMGLWAQAGDTAPRPTHPPTSTATKVPPTPTLPATVTPVPSPTPTPTPEPILIPTPTPVAIIRPEWQGEASACFLRLKPVESPSSISLTIDGTAIHTHTLTIDGEGLVALFHIYEPGVTEVRVQSTKSVVVERVEYVPYDYPVSSIWWIPVTSHLQASHLVLRPFQKSLTATARLPNGKIVQLSRGNGDRLPYLSGVYEIRSQRAFRLDAWILH